MQPTASTPELRELLRQAGPLAFLTDAEHDQIAQRLTVRAYRFGDTILTAGETGDEFFLVVSGRARVVGLDATGREVTLGLLSRGDHFGEMALLTQAPRRATVRAAEDLQVAVLTRRDFEAAAAAHTEIGPFLQRYVAELGVRNFLKQFTVLGLVPSPVLRALVGRLQELNVAAGAVVVRQGDVGDRFFIVREGTLDVAKREGDVTRAVGQIGPGECFGEIALLKGTPRAATVTARSACRIYALNRADFESTVRAYPELRHRLEGLMATYERRDRRPPEPAPATTDVTHNAAPTAGERDWARVAATASGPTAAPPPPRRWFRRHPFIAQHDETDCGAASLAMIAAYHGLRIGVGRLRDLANVDRDGASMWSVAQAAEKLGFRARGLQLACDALRDAALPCIAHWEGFHFIVLYQVGARRIKVGDPALGIRYLTPEAFKKGFTGRILELTPAGPLPSLARRATSWQRFGAVLRAHAGLIGWIFGASVLLNVLALGLPLFMQWILDRVLVGRSLPLLNLLGLGMLALAVAQGGVSAFRRLLMVRFSTRTDLRLIGDFLRHVLQLPMPFFDLRRIGDVLSRVTENEKLRNAMSGMLPGMALDACLALGYFAFLAWYSLRFTALVMFVVPAFVALMLIFTPLLRRYQREYFAKFADQWSYLIEAIAGIHTVKAMAVEDTVRTRWERLFGETLATGARRANLELLYSSLALILSAIASALFLWYGARQALHGLLTAGQLVALSTIAGNVVAPLLRLVEDWQELQDVRNAVERLNDVFDAEPEETEAGARERLTLERLAGHIRFEGVTFRYTPAQEKPTLTRLSFEILPGETVAIVGRSGCGKSTLAKLILGLYLPTEGRVLLDGHDMRIVARAALRRRIGVVPQDIYLFSGTIRENVALGVEADERRVVAACQAAAADGFIRELGMGYDTKVGERGMSLSGGQRQRLALARALLREPDLLILDEATSALDTDSERAIQTNLERLFRGKTRIVIAHRMSTVRHADRILVLDRGALIEEGTHEQLVQRNGLYAHLVGQQLSL